MEIELSLGRANYLREISLALFLLSLMGMGWLGRSVTQAGSDGNAQILTWSNYQLGKAENAYLEERKILREDADTLMKMLGQENIPGPVAVQVAANRIIDHSNSGVTELSAARKALTNAAVTVRDWSVGLVDKNTAIQSVQAAVSLLEE